MYQFSFLFKIIFIPKTTLSFGSDGLTVGRKEGRNDGRTEGRTDGRADGRTDGRAGGRGRFGGGFRAPPLPGVKFIFSDRV